jgi:tetratricopeptide (TPR) repeat protein
MADRPGRNDPCPCGTGRKYKRCCGADAAGASKPNAEADGLVRQGKRHLEAGQYEQAVGALLRAAQLVPDSPAIFADLGKACLFTRRLQEAINCLRRSIALRPAFAAVHHDLGHALEQAGDLEGALAAHRRAAELAPTLAAAHGRVGDLLTGMGRRGEAAEAYERAFAASRGTTLGRLSGAKALILRDRSDEAREQLRKLVTLDASNAEAHLVLGLILNEAGEFDEAAASFERSIELSPLQATAHHGLVSSRRITEADRPVIERILSRLAGPPMTETQRMTLHFAAGKALDDLKDYAGATGHFDAANRIRRKLAPFDRRSFERLVDRLIARFTPALFAAGTSMGTDDETPVLVVGMPRSGTTLIERIISSHPRAAGGGELVFWNEHAPTWTEAEVDPIAADRLRGDYLGVLRAIGPDAACVTDKMPFNFLWIGLVHLLLPRARIVHCRRNPIDTCLSIFQTQFAQNWSFASDRGDLASYYRQYLRLMDHWRAVIPADRLIDVDYESAIGQPEETARRLIAFCGLPWDGACLNPERNPHAVKTASKWQARQPIYRTSIERWRHYEPWIGELRTLAI